MPAKYKLEIITPERTVFSGEVESVIVPTPDGYLSVQRMHEPMVCALSIGLLRLNMTAYGGNVLRPRALWRCGPTRR